MEPTQAPVPTIGRIVLYKLASNDVAQINAEREKIKEATPTYQGNPVSEGAVVPAMIVAVWGDTPDSCVNLKLLLDGLDDGWATSRDRSKEGHEAGQWIWPPRV